jgi:hypothetical protein
MEDTAMFPEFQASPRRWTVYMPSDESGHSIDTAAWDLAENTARDSRRMRGDPSVYNWEDTGVDLFGRPFMPAAPRVL